MRQNHQLSTLSFAAAAACLCVGLGFTSVKASDPAAKKKSNVPTSVATFGGGCFWCVEAVFERMKGVSEVVSGYEGGHVENPTYEQVCTKRTGHIEVCQIHYDPTVISYEELLKVFFKTHDPTSRDAQGADHGPQYRSAIFYHDDVQMEAAEAYIKKLNESKTFGPRRIVTVVKKTEVFYPAEDYHQDYFAKNPNDAYCQAVARPKVEKVEEEFADKLKSEDSQ